MLWSTVRVHCAFTSLTAVTHVSIFGNGLSTVNRFHLYTNDNTVIRSGWSLATRACVSCLCWSLVLKTYWPWSYSSWIYSYLCNQCISPLMLWVRISTRARCTTLYDKVNQWLAAGRWFSLGPPVCTTSKTDRHDMAEMLLKVALNTIKQTSKQIYFE